MVKGYNRCQFDKISLWFFLSFLYDQIAIRIKNYRMKTLINARKMNALKDIALPNWIILVVVIYHL